MDQINIRNSGISDAALFHFASDGQNSRLDGLKTEDDQRRRKQTREQDTSFLHDELISLP